jgi:undecaprenyl-diphosphatase
VFAASFLEAVAVIGTVVPGSTVVFAGGVLVGLRALDPWLAAGASIAGAILGDGISYWLGRHYHGAIRSMWPMYRYPGLFARGEAYFAAHGGKSVFLGRFLGPLRAIVPVIAGMVNMPPAHFYLMNVLSALAWAAAHLLPGVLFGASLQLAGAVSSRLVVLLAAVVIGLWLFATIIRLVLRWGVPHVIRLRERLFVHASASHGPLARLVLPLIDPVRREPFALLVAATLMVAGAWLFLGVVEDVVTNDTLVDVDRGIYESLQGLRTDWGDDLLVTVTQLGSPYVVIALIAAVALWLAITRRFRTLAYWIAAPLFAELLVWTLKYALGRARPDTPYAIVDEYSLPSGHAALSLVVYGFLAFLIGHGKPRWQQTALGLAAAAIALLMGFSRLYLGAHWFSDVIASFGLAIAWMGLLAIAYINHVREPALRATPVLLVVLATLTFVGGSYANNHHARDLGRYARPTMLRTFRLEGWTGGEWRNLPAARAEFSGRSEEPFSIQWAATPEEVAGTLSAAGWRAPAPWRSSAALLWLLPSTPIGELPVLPKLHQGHAPAITFVRPLDAHARIVIRLWRVANVLDDRDAPRVVPLWSGMITTERVRSEFGLVETTRTTDVATPVDDALGAAVQGAHVVRSGRDAGGQRVELVW